MHYPKHAQMCSAEYYYIVTIVMRAGEKRTDHRVTRRQFRR